ncbi:MAG: hypothetical protein ACFFD1_05155, partial [Candidatus Thorarchaeota archaeon]
SKIDTKDKDTMVMKYLTMIFSILSVIWALILMWTDVDYHWFTLFLLFAYAVVLLSHPVKDFEGWKVFLLLFPLLIILFGALWLTHDRQAHIPLVGNIPLLIIFLVITLAFIVIFLIIFFVEETAVDPFLAIIGWAPWVVLLSIVVILQGLIMLITQDTQGLTHYISY